MGRTDEVQFLLECSRAWQSRGVRVTFQAGWETRGNGLQGNYEGCIIHHTAFLSSAAKPNPALNTLIKGRSDLSGPLCNVTGPWCDPSAPLLHVIAAFPSNHAGASGGRSMGPLPTTSLFNPRVLGLEIDYAGLTPMAPGQYRAATIFARGVCDVLGRSTEYARAHGETSITGKWDPGYANGKTIDMAAFRRDAAAAQGDDDLNDRQNILLEDIHLWMRGGHPEVDTLTVLFRQHLDMPRAVWWDATVARADGSVPVIQELADAKTQAIAANAQAAGFKEALAQVAAGSGQALDMDKVNAQIDASVKKSIESIAVTVNVKDTA